MRRLIFSVVVACFASFACCQSGFGQLSTGWKAHDLSRPAPVVVQPGAKVGNAPSDAIVLFDGTDLSRWRSARGENQEAKWEIVDGAMESVKGSGFVATKEKFGDCQLHVEFASPTPAKGNGQGRGNSGVFLMGEFEVQVLDSFENETYADGGAGSIYGQFPPLANASRPPGEWQTYDIIFRRPRFDEDGKLTRPARLTVLHNGVLVQDGSEALGPTSWILHKKYEQMNGKTEGPISLQDHGNPVRYRNIWVRRLEELRAQPEEKYDPVVIELSETDAKNLVGNYGRFDVKLEGGNLLIKEAGQYLQLVPHSKTEFGFTKSAGTVTFEVDEQGVGQSVVVHLDAYGANPRTAKRKGDDGKKKNKKNG